MRVRIVYRAGEVLPSAGSFPGKGEALWKSLLVTKGDLLVFIDADLTRWGPHFVTGLLGPLLADEQVQLVKGFYTRVRTESDGSTSTEGGRVTELVARPLISLWWPELAGVVQPLAGEWAARRSLMESLSIPVGYGVELATLMDTSARYGLDAVAQVDLGSRAHRHQANHDLALMAAELLRGGRAARARRSASSRPADRCSGSSCARRRPGPAGIPAGPGRPSGHLRHRYAEQRGASVVTAGSASRAHRACCELGKQLVPAQSALIMGIVNRTPDSFFRPGLTWDESAAMERVHQVIAEGADIVDVGGVPAAPGAQVDAAEEIRRTAGFIGAVRAAYPDIVISVDTWRHEIRPSCLRGGRRPASTTAGAVSTSGWPTWPPSSEPGWSARMSGRQRPRTRPFRVAYADVMADVLDQTQRLARRAIEAGVEPERIIIDAAHDFGKNTWHSLEVTRRLDEMTETGWPVLVSLSNKDFVGETLNLPPEQRLPGTLAAPRCAPGSAPGSSARIRSPSHGRLWTWSRRSAATSRRPARSGDWPDRDHRSRPVPGAAVARPRADRRGPGPARVAQGLPGRCGRAAGRAGRTWLPSSAWPAETRAWTRARAARPGAVRTRADRSRQARPGLGPAAHPAVPRPAAAARARRAAARPGRIRRPAGSCTRSPRTSTGRDVRGARRSARAPPRSAWHCW